MPKIRGNGKFSVEAVGESFYTANFRAVFAAQRREDAEGTIEATAELRLDDDNPHDRKAVAVLVNGLQLGNLSRQMARDLRSAIARDGLAKYRTFLVNAQVYMGGEDEVWSVALDLPED